MSVQRERESKNQSSYSHKFRKGLTLTLPGDDDDELYYNSHAASATTIVKKEKGVANSANDEIMDTTEKERRKKIRSLFGDLHAMLPHVPPQADKVTIVDETMNYIKTLEGTLTNLEKKRMERFKAAKEQQAAASSSTSIGRNNRNNEPEEVKYQTWTSSNVVVSITGQEANFSVCSTKSRGVLTTICCVFEKYKIEVLSAHISCDSNNRRFYMLQALVNKDSAQLPAAMLSAEDIFRQAAEEIIQSVY